MNFFEACIERRIKAHPHSVLAEDGRTPVERTVERFTSGDFITAVLAIEEEEDMRNFYAGAVEFYGKHPGTHTAKETAQLNIGWCFGEGMAQDRIDLWVKACGAFHPVFGVQKPSAEDAFRSGLKAGKRIKARPDATRTDSQEKD